MRSASRWVLAIGLGLWATGGTVVGQEMADDPLLEEQIESEGMRRLRELNGTDAQEQRAKEKMRPRFEFYRSQVAPFDILPYVKSNHWVTMTQEMQANLEDYQGGIRTAPVRLLGMPHAMVFGRDARLVKEQPGRLSFQAIFPRRTKSVDLDLIMPGAIRPDDRTQAPLSAMEPHQMLIVLLAADPSAYATWRRYQAFMPANVERDASAVVEVQRYYRLVTSQEPEKSPNLSAHPLTWSTISHVIWDEIDPNLLNVGQQLAMVDWLHWGGQLIIGGGAGKTLALVSDEECFLSPYLPAVPSGENDALTAEALKPMGLEYPVPGWRSGAALPDEIAEEGEVAIDAMLDAYDRPAAARYVGRTAIAPPPNRPVYLAGLRPTSVDAQPIPLDDGTGRVLGYERRVGRGRVLVLAIDPKEPAFMSWKGYDTFVRRVLLRRPEDPWKPEEPSDQAMLAGPDLSWVRYAARDINPAGLTADPETPPDPNSPMMNDQVMPQEPVAAWLDDSTLPDLSRKELVKASGIVVPGSPFVLRVMLGYLIALVPLNWLICRFVLRRKELAWIAVPLLAIGFAVAVERAAAIDMGFDLACDEIDVMEVQPGYSRAHLSRFGVLYCTSRERFTIAFPGEPSALALPLNANLSLRGEETTESTWQSAPVPGLMNFRVEPRSLAMYRAEQMMDLGGEIGIVSDAEGRRLVNATDLELRDAVLVDAGGGSDAKGRSLRPLGNIGPGQEVPIGEKLAATPGAGDERLDWIDLSKFTNELLNYDWRRPEDRGELRLVAWARDPRPGQELDPKVDRHRGFTLVVAHLAYGPPPSPDGPSYDRSPPLTTTPARSGRPVLPGSLLSTALAEPPPPCSRSEISRSAMVSSLRSTT